MFSNEIERQNKYLYPTEDLLNKANKLARTFTSTLLIIFFVLIAGIVILSVLIPLFLEKYLWIQEVIYGAIAIIIIAPMIVLAALRWRLSKKQYALLIKDRQKYSRQIELHDISNKYKRKWNIILSINLILGLLVCLLYYFISRAIGKWNESISILLILLFVFSLIIDLILMFNAARYMRKQSAVIEREIDFDTNSDVFTP